LPGDLEEVADEAMVPAIYNGIPGTVGCAAPGGDTFCSISHRTTDDAGLPTVTYGEGFSFTPAPGAWVYSEDMDWLAAGVWMTAPDDNPEGDYAVGAYAWGSEPYTGSPIDTATYNGSAFGRYAEGMGDDMTVGRFTAAAKLTANFADDMIHGTVTDFMGTDGEKDWDLNLERAMIDTDFTFADSVSGHGGGGHNLDGLWNGQFFDTGGLQAINDALAAENRLDADDRNAEYISDLEAAQLHPGSVAGTFVATDRDDEDSYSLTLGGAFGAHRGVPERPAAEEE
jgi:hypothetical protein